MIRRVVAAALAAVAMQAVHAGQEAGSRTSAGAGPRFVTPQTPYPDGSSPAAVSERELESLSAGRTVRVRHATGAIADIPLEQYVARVLAAEGEPGAAPAAQQALAMAIRTFAAVNRGRHLRGGFDLCDTTHCQVLRPATPASREAAGATAGRLLTYLGRPAEVFYSASCGGRSEAASEIWSGAANLPYLRSSDDDVHGAEEPWTLEVPLARVEHALRRAGFEGRRLQGVEVERMTGSGRVASLRLSGLRPERVAGEDLRAVLGTRELRSTRFTLETSGRVLRFVGRGYGHGVGLCVVGASRRAARGETAAAILEHYYPGLRVEALAAASLPAVSPAAAADGAAVVAPAVTPAVAPGRSPASGGSPAPVLGLPEQRALRARDELAARLGIGERPVPRVRLHESLESFRRATGRPWWTGVAVEGVWIDLAPLTVLEARDGLETAVRRGVAEMLLSPLLDGRPAWIRVGAARYYAVDAGPAQRGIGTPRGRCPADAELTMPVSAAAHRLAELRAEACFARELGKVGDWRAVR